MSRALSLWIGKLFPPIRQATQLAPCLPRFISPNPQRLQNQHLCKPPGGGYGCPGSPQAHTSISISFHWSYTSFVFMLLRTLLHSAIRQLFSPQSLPNSFAKTPGVGVPGTRSACFLFHFLVTSLLPYFLPHTRSAIAPSIRWKKNNPPTNTTTTAAVDASNNGPGGCPCPVSAHRNPSITPAMGFNPYSHRHRCDTSEEGYATGEANIQNWIRNGTT